jgi:hypothetical protein
MPLKTNLKSTHLVPASQAWGENMQCVLYGKYSFPDTDFCLGYQKFIMWAHNAGFVRERFRTDFSGFERDDLNEHVCFGVSSFWGLFCIQA